jgi:hypothetical protein
MEGPYYVHTLATQWMVRGLRAREGRREGGRGRKSVHLGGGAVESGGYARSHGGDSSHLCEPRHHAWGHCDGCSGAAGA